MIVCAVYEACPQLMYNDSVHMIALRLQLRRLGNVDRDSIRY